MSAARLLLLRLLAAAIAVPALSGAAAAHAFLRHATPAVGGTLATPPAQVTLDFTEAVEPRFSGIEVLDAAGARVDAGDPHTAPDNAKRLMIGLKPLKPGAYKVKWHVTSVDTHHTEGVFSFSVQP
jgi:methionine-rich copper-binding protein CopC